jgi:steroid delta-isomerase-like uncharacterized protein
MTDSSLATTVKESLLALNDAAARNPLAETAWMKLHSPDVVSYGFGEEPLRGRDALIDSYEEFYAAFPNLQLEISEAIPAGVSDVVTRGIWNGPHEGEYAGIPATGRRIDGMVSMSIYRFSDGLITERFSVIDQLDMFVKIGAVTLP